MKTSSAMENGISLLHRHLGKTIVTIGVGVVGGVITWQTNVMMTEQRYFRQEIIEAVTRLETQVEYAFEGRATQGDINGVYRELDNLRDRVQALETR